MGDVYRVQVVRESGSGSDYETETVFELAGGIGLVARMAPGAVVDVLRALSEGEEPGQVPLAERVMDAAAAAGAPVAPSGHPFQDAQPAKRSRRTKAQIAADNEAQAAGFRDAAHRAEAEATQQRINTAQANAAAAGGEPPAQPEMAPEGPIVPVQGTPAPDAGEAVQVTTTFAGAKPIEPPAAPFNPFEVK